VDVAQEDGRDARMKDGTQGSAADSGYRPERNRDERMEAVCERLFGSDNGKD
jgi:hypothetical protein